MKVRNLPRWGLALLVTFIASTFFSITPVTAANVGWSSLNMPQNAGTVVDIGISPNQDGLLYLLAFNNGHNIWRTLNDGGSWQQIFQTGDPRLAAPDRVVVARNGTLFIAGNSSTGPAYLKSNDNGQTFTSFTLPVGLDSTSGFAALNDQRIFFTSFDGSRSRVWRTVNGSSFENTVVSATPLSILELSPSFAADNTLLTAGGDGNVYASTDGGVTFTALQQSPLS